jgi:hypothetical protein
MVRLPRLGCFGSLVFTVAILLGVYAIVAPWAFHIGGRLTPGIWWGVGRIRDSYGAQYGLYAYFSPYLRGGATRLGKMPWPRYSLRGSAWACTAAGAKYQFDLSGDIFGAWLDTDGKDVQIYLRERGRPKPTRRFSLYGRWNGQDLVLDDHKTMFMNFRPGGTLTPTGSYTSPVPERHATVTLSWGNYGEFESLCAGLARSH